MYNPYKYCWINRNNENAQKYLIDLENCFTWKCYQMYSKPIITIYTYSMIIINHTF